MCSLLLLVYLLFWLVYKIVLKSDLCRMKVPNVNEKTKVFVKKTSKHGKGSN